MATPGLPDHCISEGKGLTIRFVFFVYAFWFLCLLDGTNDDLALWLATRVVSIPE